MVEKLVGINGYDLEVPLSDHMLVFEYSDRPGVIGNVGRILGDAGINIGGMQVSRQDDRAIGVLNVDSAVPTGARRLAERGHRGHDLLGRRPAGLTAARLTGRRPIECPLPDARSGHSTAGGRDVPVECHRPEALALRRRSGAATWRTPRLRKWKPPVPRVTEAYRRVT